MIIVLGMGVDLCYVVCMIYVGLLKNLEGESIEMYNFYILK